MMDARELSNLSPEATYTVGGETRCQITGSNAPDLAATKVVGGREVGCGRSPGGALRVSFEDGGAQTELVMHDGSMLSGVTAALKVGGAVVLGSAEARGVLVCEV